MRKLIYLLTLLVSYSVGYAQVNETVIGAGATFPYPLYFKMFSEYSKLTQLKVNYQPIGSGGGIQQLMAKTVDFGASDVVLNSQQESAMTATVVHIPVTAGAVAICYNLPGVKGTVKLNPSLLSDIFLGKIKRWNDKRIKDINGALRLPAIDIIVVHRTDGSGTTNIFTTYLSEVSTDWNALTGKGTSVNWPVGLGAKGNEGVAGIVKQTPGAVGYVELAYARQNSLSFAALRNKSGKFIVPSVESTTAASRIDIPADGKVSLVNTDGTDGYPITGFTWILVYKEQNYDNHSLIKATEMMKMLWWMTHNAQKYCEPMTYAPLSKSAVKVAESIIHSVTYNGKPVLN